MYQLIIMSKAQKDAKKLASSGLKPKTLKLLEIIKGGFNLMRLRVVLII